MALKIVAEKLYRNTKLYLAIDGLLTVNEVNITKLYV
jgi:hypothetical protein